MLDQQCLGATISIPNWLQRSFRLCRPDERADAVEGLLTCLSAARPAPMRLRAHLFFRSVQGLWACSNPQCTQRMGGRQAGQSAGCITSPYSRVRCGARFGTARLRMLRGGVLWRLPPTRPQNPGSWYLSPDHPDLETAPETAFLDRRYDNYAVFWPSPDGAAPATPNWTQDNVPRRWQPRALIPEKRVWTSAAATEFAAFSIMFQTPRRLLTKHIPPFVPAAMKTAGGGGLIHPIRPMRTGFQRVAQVLSDTLMREMPHTPQQSSRKLVVFSDSRQDAAKLSAGMRFAHYRDAVRQALATRWKRQGLARWPSNGKLPARRSAADEARLAQKFAATHPNEVATLSLAQNPALANRQAPGFAGLTYAVAAQQILQRGEHGPFPISILTEDISARLLAQGINPGGFTQDVLWTNPRRREGPWRRL